MPAQTDNPSCQDHNYDHDRHNTHSLLQPQGYGSSSFVRSAELKNFDRFLPSVSASNDDVYGYQPTIISPSYDWTTQSHLLLPNSCSTYSLVLLMAVLLTMETYPDMYPSRMDVSGQYASARQGITTCFHTYHEHYTLSENAHSNEVSLKARFALLHNALLRYHSSAAPSTLYPWWYKPSYMYSGIYIRSSWIWLQISQRWVLKQASYQVIARSWDT